MTSPTPASVDSTQYFGCDSPNPAFVGPSQDVADPSDCSTYDPGGGGPQSCTNNEAIDAATFAANFVSYATDNMHLVTSPPSASVHFGGLDASGAAYGNVTVDRDGRPRTCPTPGTACFSVGAYEVD